MDFKKFLPEEIGEKEVNLEANETKNLKETKNNEKISPNQVYHIITDKKPDWQSIIYDLINSEQLDPWDIDIVLLTRRYFEKIIELEELEETREIDFYVSSRVLLAAALLLRIKSEFLLNKYIRSIDEILFGKKNEEKKIIEKIEIDDDDLPILLPKTPMSRMRKVTLPELMAALNKAINTESRRIKREVQIKRAKKLSEVDFPTFRRIDLKDRIRQFYARVLTSLKKPQPLEKISYSKLVGIEKEEKLACFLPLLHLENNKKLWTEQENHLEEIWIYLYSHFEKNKDKYFQDLEKDIEEMKEELQNSENIDEKVDNLEKARQKREEKKKFQEDIKKELENELKIQLNNKIAEEVKDIENQEKINEITGFDEEIE